MKPFDLEAAKRGEPITTQGEELFYVGLDRKGNIVTEDSFGDFEVFMPWQLYMVSIKRTVWVNLYSHSGASFYNTQDEANLRGSGDRLGGRAWPLEIEE
jgi:hypothetical protein